MVYDGEEIYETREAPNRQIAWLMEKDNKKLRVAAKKEWDEQVRLGRLNSPAILDIILIWSMVGRRHLTQEKLQTDGL